MDLAPWIVLTPIFIALFFWLLWKTDGMYVPHHSHWWLTVAVVAYGFYTWKQFGELLIIALLMWTPLDAIAIAWGIYLWQAGVVYQKYLAKVDGNETVYKPDAPVKKTYADLNRPVFEQTVTAVRFDMERQFAKTLLIMHGYKPNDEAVNLTEDYWKRPNKFGTREAYIVIRDKWDLHKIIGRKSARKNASYRVLDWRAVELIADGNRLPS